MAIQHLEVYGFRSLKSVAWVPGPLNIIVGANGSGKSNLVRALQFITQAARGTLRSAIDENSGMIPLLWDHRSGSLGWRVRIDPVDENRDRISDALTYELEVGQIGAGSAYEIRKDSLGNWFKFSQGLEPSPYWVFHRDARHAVFYDHTQRKLADFRDDPAGFEENESLLSQISDLRNRIPSFAKRIFGNWAIHHDVHVDQGSIVRRPATTQHTTQLASDGSNLAPFLHTLYSDRAFREMIDEGMRAGFGQEYEKLDFPPAAASQIQLAVSWKSSSRSHVAQDLSDGTLRFLLILAALANPNPPALIVIDEPEAGLHPSMLSIIAEYAVAAAQRTQVILTSHSPEFLDAFSDYSPTVTLCHWDDGQTSVVSLEPERLARWLKAYRLGQMFTHGELENLSLPPVDVVEGFEARVPSLPSDETAPSTSKSR